MRNMITQRANQITSKGKKTGTAFMLETYFDKNINKVVSRFTEYNAKTLEDYTFKIYQRVPSSVAKLFQS
jgi:hypothetical protein